MHHSWQYPEFFVNVMMAEELELQVPDEDDNPWVDGRYICSLVVFGTIPLLGYLCFYAAGFSPQVLFIIACRITACALFGLGVVTKITKQVWYKSGCRFLGWVEAQLVPT